MKKFETIDNHAKFQQHELTKTCTLQKRREMSLFTDVALDGDYDAIYLNIIQRSTNSTTSDRYHKIMRDGKFGKVTDSHIIELKEMQASQSEMENDEKFKDAQIVIALHYFNPDNSTAKTVETENIKKTFEFAKNHDNAPIVHLKALHTPFDRTSALEQLPGR